MQHGCFTYVLMYIVLCTVIVVLCVSRCTWWINMRALKPGWACYMCTCTVIHVTAVASVVECRNLVVVGLNQVQRVKLFVWVLYQSDDIVVGTGTWRRTGLESPGLLPTDSPSNMYGNMYGNVVCVVYL